MSNLYRPRPPRIRQSLADSCWAAVLESWSTIDRRIAHQQEGQLISSYGEGPTGGITPGIKIPKIARRLNLRWGGFAAADLDGYITDNMRRSHLFCAYRSGRFQHAVLIYGYDGNNVHAMDPRQGAHVTLTRSWLERRAPFVMMRR